MRGKGLLCAAFTIILTTPEVVQAGQEGGAAGAALAVGGLATDAAIGLGASTAVGVGITTTAAAAGTTITVGGTAVTGVVGATGIGGAAINAATIGYATGNAYGNMTQLNGQAVHENTATGIIIILDYFGLWWVLS